MMRRLGRDPRAQFAFFSLLASMLVLTWGAGVGCGGGGSGGFNVNVADSGAAADVLAHDSGVLVEASPEGSGFGACPAPTFSPPGGTADPGNVTITDTGLPAHGNIYYTVDGTNPTATSTAYAGPIQVTQNVSFRAAALAPGCSLSAITTASYTVTPLDGGGLPAVTFVPKSQVQPNDFLVTLSDNPGATICYTLDGSTPACAAGVCTGTSSTYSSTSSISINGGVTALTTGQVTVTAIACVAGEANSPTASQIYTLQAAAPTLTGLANGDQPYVLHANFLPAIQSITITSTTPADAPSIWYTTDGTMPSCSSGKTTANPTTFNATGAPTLPQTNGQLQALTCKTGYLPSPIATWSYTFTLNTPTLTGGTFFAQPTVLTGVTASAGNVLDAANNLGADAICATTDGTTPTCAVGGGCCTVAGACPGAGATEVAVTSTTGPKAGNAASANTTIEVVACPIAGLLPINASAASTATFTLQLPAPFLSSGDPDATGLPGWDSTTDGKPVTGFALPSSYASATAYPYGDTCNAVPCVLDVAEVQGPGASCPAAGGAGCVKYQTADYYCWSLSGTAACGCAAANQVATGNGGFNGEVSKALPAGAGVTAGKTLSLIACQNAAAPTLFGASAPTNIVVSGPAQATAPAISPPALTPYLSQATATVTNQDALASAVCWTYSSPALTPTCTAAGACNTVCPVSAICGSLKLGSKNDVPADNVYTFQPGSTDGTGAGATKYPGPAGYDLASATNARGLLQLNGFVLSAVACNAAEVASPAATQTYSFQMGVPHVSSEAAYIAGQYGDLDAPTAVGAGQLVYLTDTSNYDVAAAASLPTVAYTTGPGAVCGGPHVALQKVTFGGGTTLGDVWDNGKSPPGQTPTPATAPATGATWELGFLGCGQTVADQLSSAATTVTYTLAAAAPLITTNQDPAVGQGLDQPSALCTVGGTCGTAGSKPCCTCSITTATCGTAGNLPCCCSVQGTLQGGAPASCTPSPTWENAFTAYISSPTPGTSICYSTVATPMCNNGVCSGGITNANGNPITLAIANSPTTVYAIGCAANLPESQAVTLQFDVKTTGATLVSSGVGSCSPNPYIQLSSDPAHGNTPGVADTSLGGPSASTCLCYTVDGTPAGGACNATACTAHPVGTTATCFRAFAAGVYAENQLTLSSTTTVNWSTCSNGFDTNTGAPLFSTQPYRETITVDGVLTEWDQTTWGTATQLRNDDTNVVYTDEYTHTVTDDVPGDAMFTYDANNLYFALAPTTSLGPSNTNNMCCNANGAACAHGTCYPAAASTLAIYIGTGVAGGATTDLPLLDPGLREATRALPAAAGVRYAFTWQTGTNTAPAAWVWTPGTPGSWGPGAFSVNVGYQASTGAVEFGVLQSALGFTAASAVTVLGTVVGDTGANGPPASGSSNVLAWPDGAWQSARTTGECADSYGSYWAVNTASCSSPVSQLVLGGACL